MEHFFGIDIGGTNVKIGLVDSTTGLIDKIKYSSTELQEGGKFITNFSRVLGEELAKHPEVKKAGIGIPGTITKDGRSTLEIPNLDLLSHKSLANILEKDHPGVQFILENDAHVAALGEYYFGVEKLPENYLFITLGTGVGGAAIIDRKVFKGGDGNPMEIGHILSRNGKELEALIGKAGLMELINDILNKSKSGSKIGKKMEAWDTKLLVSAAEGNDKVAIKIFKKIGTLLGEALVSTIRLLDIKTIIVGGGLSASYNFVNKPMMKVMNKKLTPYYTKDISVKKASLGNNAGIIGAASLWFK
jgi:glucokinase